MRLPTYEEISSDEKQMEVREWPLDESLFVVGPPGSGKTVLAVLRAEMVSEWVEEKDVSVVTYNRMLKRLLDLLNRGGVDASTMHSFIWNHYTQVFKESAVPTLQTNSYAYNWKDMIDRLRQSTVSSSLFCLVVDEGQDLPVDFFEYVPRYVAQTLTVFADEDQALSDRHTTLEQIKDAAGLDNPIILRHNHRNTPEVARVAEHFHSGRLPAAVVSRNSIGEKPQLVKTGDIDQVAILVSNWRQTRGGSVGVIVARNDTGVEIYQRLKERLSETRVDIYRNDDRNENSTNVLDDGVTVLNKESVKGQEFDTVFILEFDFLIPFTNNKDRRAMYMMCSRARDYLFLIYGPTELSGPAAETLPGPEILERV